MLSRERMTHDESRVLTALLGHMVYNAGRAFCFTLRTAVYGTAARSVTEVFQAD